MGRFFSKSFFLIIIVAIFLTAVLSLGAVNTLALRSTSLTIKEVRDAINAQQASNPGLDVRWAVGKLLQDAHGRPTDNVLDNLDPQPGGAMTAEQALKYWEDLGYNVPPGSSATPAPNPGTCKVERVGIQGGRGTTKQVVNNCNSGFKPNPIYGTIDRCTCVPDSTQICSKRGKTCATDPECNTQPGCSTYVCFGAIQGHKPGECRDSTTICSKAELNCSTDASCQDGSQGCANYTCWTVGKGKACRLGQQPIQAPTRTPTPSITPVPDPPDDSAHCSRWGDRFGTPIQDKDLDKFRDGNGNLRIKDNLLRCLEVNTAIGPIGTEPKQFVARIFSLVLGLAGGIALILIIISGYKFMTSGGNPESFNAAKDTLVSAIVGLLFIIFAFIILQIIGVDILHIPGFG